QPANITVTGANSRLRGEDDLTVSGNLRVLNGASVFLLSLDALHLTNCQALVSGPGSNIMASPRADASSSIIVEYGASLGVGISNATCNAPVTIGPGCTLNSGGQFTSLLSIDFDSTVNAAFLAVTQGLTVTLDGLTTRTTPLIYCGAQG